VVLKNFNFSSKLKRGEKITIKLYYLKQLRPIGKGEQVLREKVRSKRINLEGNTHAQEINVSQCPV
jgi:hypothetical protein